MVEAGSGPDAHPAPRGGLYQGFEGYRTPSAEQYRAALKSALVVLDTNVFLNLYRYNDQTRQSIIEVLKALGDRFWVPRQVMEEFWRNRERALTSPLSEVRDSISDLKKQLNAATETIRFWANRAALTEEETDAIERDLSECFSKAETIIAGLVDADRINSARNTNNDEVLVLIEPVLDGHVGEPMSEVEYAKALAEGKRRVEAGEPPDLPTQGRAMVAPRVRRVTILSGSRCFVRRNVANSTSSL
jgi:hypothetical protein